MNFVLNKTKTCFILLCTLMFLFFASPGYCAVIQDGAQYGTLEVQAMVPEGFVAPITIEMIGKDDYAVKTVVTKNNGYIVKEKLPEGTYTIESMYVDSKEETDSSMWADSETVKIKGNATSILQVAVIDDDESRATITFGPENNPFGAMSEDPEDFMKENAAKLEAENKKNDEKKDDNKVESDTEKESDKNSDDKESVEDKKPSNAIIPEDLNTESVSKKGVSLVIDLAVYVLKCVGLLILVSGGVWLYRRWKYGE